MRESPAATAGVRPAEPDAAGRKVQFPFWVLPPLLLAALLVPFFWKLLFLGRALGGLDVLEYFYPYRAYAAQAIHQGRLPLWNPDIFGGVPFLANIQTALFYPLTGLFYILNVTAAYTWSILVHVFLGALFAYLYARTSLRLHAVPALIAALVFGFGGFMGGQLGHLNQFSAAIWLPALLICWDRAAQGQLLFVLLGALAVTMLLFAGHPQEAYLTLFALLLYALFETVVALRASGLSGLLRRVVSTAVLLGLGAALAAVQLLPTAELTSWSIRSGGLPYSLATTFSLNATELLNALLPPFWNRAFLVEVPGASEYMGYVGLLTLLLSLAGLIYARRRFTLFFAGLAALSLFLTLGKQNPLFPAFYHYVPGFNVLRVPARWLFTYTLGVAMLAALGAEALLHEKRRLNWRPLVLAAALLALAGLALSRIQKLPPADTIATWAAFGALALVICLGAMLIRKPRVWAPVLVAVIGVELWLGGQSLDYNQPVPASVFSEPLPTTQFLQRQTPPFRVVSVANDTFVPAAEPAFRQANAGLSQEQLFAALSYYKLREILEPNTSMAEGIATIDGYDGGLLPLARYTQFKDTLAGQPSDADERLRFVIKWLPNRPLMDLAGVRYLVTDGLSDKGDGKVQYDLSSFIRVDPGQTSERLTLDQPATATSVGFVIALKGGDLPQGSKLATLTLQDGSGGQQVVPVVEGQLRPFGTLPYSEKLPTFLGKAQLDAPFPVQSVTVTLNALGEEFYLNGLALIDNRAGTYASPLVAPGGLFKRVYTGDVKVYENERALAPAFLVHGIQPAETAGDALDALRAPTFDPRALAVVEPNAGPPPSASLTGRIISRAIRLLPHPAPFTIPDSWLQTEPSLAGPATDHVSVREISPERYDVETSSTAAGFLVLTQSYFPGWQAIVDGQPDRILAADYLFQGVHLTPGNHRVEFLYRPSSVSEGAVISIAAAILWLIGFGLWLFRFSDLFRREPAVPSAFDTADDPGRAGPDGGAGPDGAPGAQV